MKKDEKRGVRPGPDGKTKEKAGVVKVTVDYDVCASTGTCVQVCPEVFEIRADGFLYLFMEEVPPELHAKAIVAEDLCPTGAITLVGHDGKPLR